MHRLVEESRIVVRATLELLLLESGVLSPPREAVARPLRMQRPHRGVSAPQLDAVRDQLPAKAIEQLLDRCALQAFAQGPAMQLDDSPAEHIVEVLNRQAPVQAAGRSSFRWACRKVGDRGVSVNCAAERVVRLAWGAMTDERRGRSQTVGAILPRIAGKALGKNGLGEAHLIQHWAESGGRAAGREHEPRQAPLSPVARGVTAR